MTIIPGAQFGREGSGTSRLLNDMKIFPHTLIVLCLLLSIPSLGLAGIYKYRDASGRLAFVDDPSKVPQQFRDDITTLSEPASPQSFRDQTGSSKELSEEPVVKRKQTDSAAARKKLREHQTPVIISNNRVLVPIEVSMGNRSAKLSLLLDTGATSTVFHRESLNGLELPSGKRYKARVAGGGTVRSVRIKFRKISIGPFQYKDPFAMVMDVKGSELSFDGMLGMDFLKNHPYQIDFEKQVIIWEPLD